jgi:inorganic pyrophosphatase
MGKKTMANPTRLPSSNGDDGVVHVVIETEKGSRNKFSYDEDLNVFRLKKVLPEGMSFPHISASCPQLSLKTAIH